MPIAARGGTLTNRSGTIAAGGTAQVLAVANTERRYFLFLNVSDIDLWLDFGATAVASQPSIKIAAGGSIVFEGSFVPTQAVSLFGATTGKAFVSKEG